MSELWLERYTDSRAPNQANSTGPYVKRGSPRNIHVVNVLSVVRYGLSITFAAARKLAQMMRRSLDELQVSIKLGLSDDDQPWIVTSICFKIGYHHPNLP